MVSKEKVAAGNPLGTSFGDDLTKDVQNCIVTQLFDSLGWSLYCNKGVVKFRKRLALHIFLKLRISRIVLLRYKICGIRLPSKLYKNRKTIYYQVRAKPPLVLILRILLLGTKQKSENSEFCARFLQLNFLSSQFAWPP